ncbi:MAG: hypothetical protein D6785_06095 [Planctomycetota bacterium]|nr:MAG: hypothetical protein D6785_06095 [Planctomycetota bacterium]
MVQNLYQEAERLYKEGKAKEASQVVEKNLGQVQDVNEKKELLLLLGKYRSAFQRGREVLAPIEEALEIIRNKGNPKDEKKGLFYFHKISGILDLDSGAPQEALDHYQKAMELGKEMSLTEEYLDLMILTGEAYFHLGSDQKAKETLQHARKTAKEKKQKLFLPAIDGLLGDIELRDGNAEQALKYYQKAFRRAKEQKNTFALVDSSSRLGKWYFYSGDPEKSLEWLQQAEKWASQIQDTIQLIDISGTIGKVYFFMGDNEKARQNYERALALSKDTKYLLGELNNLGNLGNLLLRLGKMDEGIQYFKDALKIARKLEDAQGEMNALGWLGDGYYQKGENIKALNHYYKALELSKSIRSLLGQSTNLSRIGDIYFSRHENDTAYQKYKEALDLARKANSPTAILNNLISLGDILFRQGKDEEALKSYEEAFEIACALQTPQGMLNAIQSLGDVYLRRGHLEEALLRFKQALGLSRKLEDPIAEILSLRGIGDVYYRKRDYSRAMAHQKKALELAKEIGDLLEELNQKTRIGSIYLKRGKRELAKKYFEEAYELARKFDSPEGLLPTLIGLATFDVEEGRLDDGEEKLKEAMHLSERLDAPYSKLKAISLLGWILIQKGSFQETLPLYEEAVRILKPMAAQNIDEAAKKEPSREEKLARLRQHVAWISERNVEDFQSSPQKVNLQEDTGEFRLAEDSTQKLSLDATHIDELGEEINRFQKFKAMEKEWWRALEEGLFADDLSTRVHCVIGLGKIGTRKVLPLLEKAYQIHKKDTHLIEEIIQALSRLSPADAGPTLSRLFRKETRKEIKISLAEVLASHGHLGGVEYLIHLSKEKNPFQFRAIEALGNSNQEEVQPVLWEILDSFPQDARLETIVLTALMALGDEKAKERLTGSIESEDIMNLFIAAKALARSGSPGAVQSLESLANMVMEKEKPSAEEFRVLQLALKERLKQKDNIKEFLQNLYRFRPIRAFLFLHLDSDSAPFLKNEILDTLENENKWELRANAAHGAGYLDLETLDKLYTLLEKEKVEAVKMGLLASLYRMIERVA